MKTTRKTDTLTACITMFAITGYFIVYAQSLPVYMRAVITMLYSFSLFGLLLWGGGALRLVSVSTFLAAVLLVVGIPVLFLDHISGVGGESVLMAILNLIALAWYIYLFSNYNSTNGAHGILKGAGLAGLICAIIYFLTARSDVVYVEQWKQRQVYEEFHPNLIGYCFCVFSAISLFLLTFKRGMWWVISGLTIIFSIAITVDVSSRGSLAAIMLGLLIYVVLSVSILGLRIRNRFLVLVMVLTTVVVAGIGLYGVAYLARGSENVFLAKISDSMELNNQYRGLDSGLTGRVELWKYIYSTVEFSDVFFGIGFRRSSEVYGHVDNSYIVILLENGLFPSLILALIIIRKLIHATSGLVGPSRHFSICIISAIVMILANNFVARYLLAIGNPAALLGMYIVFFSSNNVSNENGKWRRPSRINNE